MTVQKHNGILVKKMVQHTNLKLCVVVLGAGNESTTRW